MREPRWLHAGAWWAWALGLAAAASRTTNPLLLSLLVLSAATVVHARRPDAPWARSFAFFLRLGVVIIVVRIGVQVLFGAAIGTTTLVHLPGIVLPSFLAGVRLGGDVTFESVLMAFYDGLRLATILICVGAANSLASPTRLLKSVPAAMYELGVSVVVAMTFTPQLVTDVDRLQTTRRLRGRASSGPRAIAGAAVPVLEGALERSVALAAAMDSRGYGRRGTNTASARRLTVVALLGGLVACCIGAYGLVASGSPFALGLPMLAVGVLLAVAGAVAAGRTATRTRYRPDPWRVSEWLVLAAGLAVVFAFLLAQWLEPAAMNPSVDPAVWPSLPLVAVLGITLGATPAWTSPTVPLTNAVEHPTRSPATLKAAA